MRLKDPLQGIVILQGHIVMHFAMFLASYHTIDLSMIKDDQYELEKYALIYYRWAHFLAMLA